MKDTIDTRRAAPTPESGILGTLWVLGETIRFIYQYQPHPVIGW